MAFAFSPVCWKLEQPHDLRFALLHSSSACQGKVVTPRSHGLDPERTMGMKFGGRDLLGRWEDIFSVLLTASQSMLVWFNLVPFFLSIWLSICHLPP